MIIGWIFSIIALVWIFLNAQINILGFVFWMISNIGFLIINILNTNYAKAVLFFVNTLASISGIIIWCKNKKNETNF